MPPCKKFIYHLLSIIYAKGKIFINHYSLNFARPLLSFHIVPFINRSETFCPAPKISNIKSPKIYAIMRKFIYYLSSIIYAAGNYPPFHLTSCPVME